MPCGPDLVNQVASVLTDESLSALVIRNRLVGAYSVRAVRYALVELIKQGRAQRKGRYGAYATKTEEV